MHLPTTARDLMTRDPYALPAKMPIFEAAGILLREGHSGAPVVDGDRLVGVLSEHDLIRALSVVEQRKTPEGAVADWMTADPDTVSPDAAVHAIARYFERNRVRRAPVVEGGRLVGLVARQDVVRALHRIALELRRAQSDQISPPPVKGR